MKIGIPCEDGPFLALENPLIDAEKLYALIDENRSFLSQWLPWAENETLADLKQFMAYGANEFAKGKAANFLIYDHGELVGKISLKDMIFQQKAEIGYFLKQSATGKGIMTRAVRVITTLAFQEYQVQRLVIKAAPGNIPSNKVAQRTGFTFEGTLRAVEKSNDGSFLDMNIYSLLKSEWQGKL